MKNLFKSLALFVLLFSLPAWGICSEPAAENPNRITAEAGIFIVGDAYLAVSCTYERVLHPLLFAGGGAGMMWYTTDGEYSLIPVFARFRVNFKKTGIQPYFALNLGYVIPTNSDLNGNVIFDPTLGVSIPVANRTRLQIVFGVAQIPNPNFHLPTIYYNQGNNVISIPRRRNVPTGWAPSIRFGVSF